MNQFELSYVSPTLSNEAVESLIIHNSIHRTLCQLIAKQVQDEHSESSMISDASDSNATSIGCRMSSDDVVGSRMSFDYRQLSRRYLSNGESVASVCLQLHVCVIRRHSRQTAITLDRSKNKLIMSDD